MVATHAAPDRSGIAPFLVKQCPLACLEPPAPTRTRDAETPEEQADPPQFSIAKGREAVHTAHV